MPVTKQKSDYFTLSIPRKLYTKDVEKMVAYFEHLKIVSQSKVKEKDMKVLLKDLKKERSKRTKALLKERGLA